MDEATPARVTDDALTDLIERVRRTRRVANPWSGDASRGIRARELDGLVDYWGDGYDWRAQEARIRSLPWVVTGEGRSPLRSIHQPSANSSAATVVLLHGWPDSVLRFERVLPLLADCNVVVPALPGFPFSPPVGEAMSAQQIADVVADAVDELGYQRYVVSGGDVGGTLGELLAARYPDRVTALHLANVAAGHVATADPSRLPADAVEYLESVGQWRRANAGFIAEQSTRPSTLIASLGDSPAGLLAWIGEKLLDWPDTVCGEPAFSRDELLTWVTAYWFTGTIGTSFSTYVEPSRLPDRVETPTVISGFPRDIIAAPRSYAEQFVNLRQFIEHESGGHFAAWERPDAYAADVRRAVDLADPRP
ncbi:epoxide hydrolase family protein [Streptomyces phaeochromogenes]|uniref:epoxide hydrolase family protein n=1 Tax=Streptomyces phaeochromogenes TaxID=1923 RepID=UPI0033F591BD